MEIKSTEIKIMPIGEIKPTPNNRNKHPQEQIDRLAEIIKYQGFRDALIVSNQSGFLVSGNGRLEAAKLAGLTHVPVSFQDFDSPEQEYAAAISLNSISLWAELDLAGINADLPDLGPDFDIDLLGIKNFELDVAEKEGLTDEDEVPEAPVEPKTKLGDIYKLGNHRLMCGDSTSVTDVEKLMDGEKADMVFTDPPYQQEGVGGGWIGKKEGMRKLAESGLNDFSADSIAATLELLAAPSIYIFCSKKLLAPYISLLEGMGRLWDLLVMAKRNPIPSKGGNFLSDIEWLFFSRTPGAHFNDSLEYEHYYKVREVSVKPSEFGHPTEKQVQFISPYLEISSKPNDCIVDLFGGSGSTIIACEKTNRKCFMMELEPKYIDVIISRWENFTGQKAELLNGPQKETD